MLAKQVINLKKVGTGNFQDDLKMSQTHWGLMVEYGSRAPGKMFLSSEFHKQSIYKKLKLTKQIHGWNGLFEITFH